MVNCHPKEQLVSLDSKLAADENVIRFHQLYLRSRSASVGLYQLDGNHSMRLIETLRSSLDNALPEMIPMGDSRSSIVCQEIKPEVTQAFLIVVTSLQSIKDQPGTILMPVVQGNVVYYCSQTKPFKLFVGLEKLKQSL
jgi:hypothetical protein